MLSMKTLRVAIVTIGAALLLGPGFAAAVDQKLDDRPRDITPLVYASESLTATSANATNYTPPRETSASHYGLETPPGQHWLVVAAKGRVAPGNTTARFRLSLGSGMVFNSKVASTVGLKKSATSSVTGLSTAGNEHVDVSTYGDRFLGGSPGSDFIEFGLTESGVGIDIDEFLWINVNNSLAVVPGTGSYTATITASGDGAPPISATATIVNVVSALDSDVTNYNARNVSAAIADVGTDFLQFYQFATPEGVGAARLGLFRVRVRPLTGGAEILSAQDGLAAQPEDIIKGGDSAVNLTVNGDLSIGAFKIVTDRDIGNANNGSDCPSSVVGASPDNKTDSDLKLEKGVTDEGTAGLAAGSYELCVDVNDDGPNTTPIEEGNYTATIEITPPGDNVPAMEIIENQVIGLIRRNGSSNRVTYLTTAEKYNQRLIIVNRGSKMVRYSIANFVTEDGTSAEAMAAATGTIGPNMQMVIPVSDVVRFSGPRTRAAATVSVNAVPGTISVATTQVNLEDGSTDTVLYPDANTRF